MSDIEWTDKTWGVLVGCTRVSPGCQNCYAERFVHRELVPQHKGLTVLGAGVKGPRWNGTVRFVESALGKPLRWKKPRRVFVNSLSDLWHEGVSNEQCAAIFGVMAACPQHTFQVLTKRPERMRAWFRWLEEPGGVLEQGILDARLHIETARRLGAAKAWPLPNVWLGVTAEDQQRADERIPVLLNTPAAKRFVSYEPALGPVTFRDEWMRKGRGMKPLGASAGCWQCAETCDPCRPLDWIIVGGESGHGARPFDLAWARATVEQCKTAGVPVFVKQMGAKPFERIEAFGPDADGFDPNDLLKIRPRPPQMSGWTRVSTATETAYYRYPKFKNRKGNDLSEWPDENLRVREFPT